MTFEDLTVFGAPGRYIQGPNAVSRLGACAATCGRSAVLVADAFVHRLVGGQAAVSCEQAGVALSVAVFEGEVTHAALDRLDADCGTLRHDVVIGAGGGKCIDAAKALVHRRGGALITLPTVASNDSPTSKNFVVYDEHHRLFEVGHLAESPRFVLVDTALIVRAPRAFLAAGIGDALTKKFEAEQCLKARGANMFGARSSLAGVALARACYDVLRAHAPGGLAAAGSQTPTDDFERLIEAVLLMSGLGFESGGLSIAHAMTRGLSAVAGAREAVHGFQVAYGLIVQLALERRDDAFMEDLLAFYALVGLPQTLRALGVEEAGNEVFHIIAGPTLAAPHARNFERELTMEDLVAAMRAVEDRGWRGQSLAASTV
jgi:glycerol dehydrogenase